MTSYYAFTPCHTASLNRYATGSTFRCYYNVLSTSTAATVIALAERAMRQAETAGRDHYGTPGEEGLYNGLDCVEGALQ